MVDRPPLPIITTTTTTAALQVTTTTTSSSSSTPLAKRVKRTVYQEMSFREGVEHTAAMMRQLAKEWRFSPQVILSLVESYLMPTWKAISPWWHQGDPLILPHPLFNAILCKYSPPIQWRKEGNDDSTKVIEELRVSQDIPLARWITTQGSYESGLGHAVDAVRHATTLPQLEHAVLSCHALTLRLWSSLGLFTWLKPESYSRKKITHGWECIPRLWVHPPSTTTTTLPTNLNDLTRLVPPMNMRCFAALATSTLLHHPDIYIDRHAQLLVQFWNDAEQWASHPDIHPYHWHDHTGYDLGFSISKRDSLLSRASHLYPLETLARWASLKSPVGDTFMIGLALLYMHHIGSTSASARYAYALVVSAAGLSPYYMPYRCLALLSCLNTTLPLPLPISPSSPLYTRATEYLKLARTSEADAFVSFPPR